MGSLLTAALLSAGLSMSSGSAVGINAKVIKVGGDCSAAKAKAEAQTGGQVLSVQPSNGQCVIVVLVPGNGGPPKKVTMRIPM